MGCTSSSSQIVEIGKLGNSDSDIFIGIPITNQNEIIDLRSEIFVGEQIDAKNEKSEKQIKFDKYYYYLEDRCVKIYYKSGSPRGIVQLPVWECILIEEFLNSKKEKSDIFFSGKDCGVQYLIDEKWDMYGPALVQKNIFPNNCSISLIGIYEDTLK